MINVSLQENERMRAILSGFSQPTSILHGQLISLELWQKKSRIYFWKSTKNNVGKVVESKITEN